MVKFLSYSAFITFAIIIGASITLGMVSRAVSGVAVSESEANSTLNQHSGVSQNRVAQYRDRFDFSGEGRSGNRTGGGSRSECPRLEPSLTALIPDTNTGKTVSAFPTLWFYVPYTSEQVPIGEFVLQDEQGQDMARLPFTLPDRPGFVSITLPSDEAPLEIGFRYRWYFNLYCDENQESTPVFVRGWIERVAEDLETPPGIDPSELRLDQLYAFNQIWFDAINELAQLRGAQPANPDLAMGWLDLLDAPGVSLSILQDMPFLAEPIEFTDSAQSDL